MAWPLVPLSDLCSQHRAAANASDDLPYIAMDQVESNTGAICLSAGSRSGSGVGTTFKFDAKHVLYGKLRPYLNKVATPNFAGKCSTELVPLLPRAEVDRKFLAYVLRRDETINTVMTAAVGARMPRASMDVLLAMRVPLPPLAEQRRIVDILDRAAAIQRLRKAAEEKAREIIPALFVDMFGDPATNPKGWPVAKLGTLLDRIDSGWSPVCAEGTPTSDQWGILRLSAVKSSGFTGADAKPLTTGVAPRAALEVHAGDLLFTRKNTLDLVGTAAVADKSGAKRMLPDTIFRLVPSTPVSFSPRYLCALINLHSFRPRVRKLASGSASSMPGISKARLNELELPVPDIPLQKTFDETTQRLEAIVRSFETASENARLVSASLASSLLLSTQGQNE